MYNHKLMWRMNLLTVSGVVSRIHVTPSAQGGVVRLPLQTAKQLQDFNILARFLIFLQDFNIFLQSVPLGQYSTSLHVTSLYHRD